MAFKVTEFKSNLVAGGGGARPSLYKIDINSLNNLQFKKVDVRKYPSIKFLRKINNNNTLFETVLISANDELVDLYIKK